MTDEIRYENVMLTREQQDYVIGVIKELVQAVPFISREQINTGAAINLVKGKPPGDPT